MTSSEILKSSKNEDPKFQNSATSLALKICTKLLILCTIIADTWYVLLTLDPYEVGSILIFISIFFSLRLREA